MLSDVDSKVLRNAPLRNNSLDRVCDRIALGPNSTDYCPPVVMGSMAAGWDSPDYLVAAARTVLSVNIICLHSHFTSYLVFDWLSDVSNLLN